MSDIKKVFPGNVIYFRPNFDNPDSYEAADFFKEMKRVNATVMELTIVPDEHGFVNSFSVEYRFYKEDGSVVSIAEWTDMDTTIYDDYEEWEIKDIERWKTEANVDVDSSTDFLNYLSRFEDCISIEYMYEMDNDE